MKGIVLAGGHGTRLRPMTEVTNKHLLPIYDKPMIFYPIQTLVNGGIKEILIVTGKEHVGDFTELLGDGRRFGIDLTYKVQGEAGGIAQALGLAKHYISSDKCTVILGDNVYEENFSKQFEKFEKNGDGAHVFLKEVQDAERFGVAEIKGDKIIGIEEKPKAPKSKYAVTGLYMYDSGVFDVIRMLKPSGRGELELSDANNHYAKQGKLGYTILKGFWSDAGTVESLFRTTLFIGQKTKQ